MPLEITGWVDRELGQVGNKEEKNPRNCYRNFN